MGSEYTIINGVRVETGSIKWVDPKGSRPDGSRGVMLKNGTHLLIPKGKQGKNATVAGHERKFVGDGYLAPSTHGYNLNGVKITTGGNGSVWLNDSQKCVIDTNSSGNIFGEEKNDVRLIYTKPNHPRNNVIDSDSKDNLTIVEDYYPRKEKELGGNLHGMY